MRATNLLALVRLSCHALAGSAESVSDCDVPPVNTGFSFLERRVQALNETLSRREDYSCGPGRPCGNGACCGGGGYCGYGPDYCGDGCSSNCGAHAECGKYAEPKNKKCPLNTCCSQHGFCGTTKDFCDDKCQSNCVEHPKPPKGSGSGKTLSRVIGYWEAWNDRSKCHQTRAKDLPVSALTHLNYAFAYIHPETFEITTMDAATPSSTFSDLADLKWTNPNLEIFISIGGWTFSDNETATQPVFGNIARSSSNRKQFADILLKFLDSYGFDGVDIDWEYPGAPDRGGKPDDGDNFVLLLKQIRETFDTASRKLGITFTAPSSYWYLRWFDLPGVVKYVDWINLMSYDLHGTWDSSNPIGSIVQGHTNLTEIKSAVELFWRVGIKPSQIALGFGFYGRTFTLADPSCTMPGCPFKGGAKAGVCTDTSGYLAYYEVQDILEKNKITPIHDKDAAVKYFSWDNDQWISYDDAETFKQKIDWADDIGFSGSLIWASDLDDYDFTAHKALTGKTHIASSVEVADKMESKSQDLTAEIDGSFGANCYKEENSLTQQCESGYVKVGYDKNGKKCSKEDKSKGLCGQRICCPKNAGMVNCMWRGSGGDCNGRCHAGEVSITQSSWGGSPGESSEDKKCGRGKKAFCCQASKFNTLTEGCRWESECGKSCKNDEESVHTAVQLDDNTYINPSKCHKYYYCCKKDPVVPLEKCHWKGDNPDCVSNTCDKSEVTVRNDARGASVWSCSWGRKKSLCCKPNADAVKELKCDADLCADDSSLCEDFLTDEDDDSSRRRAITDNSNNNDNIVNNDLVIRTYVNPFDGHEYEYLESRLEKRFPGDPRKVKLIINGIEMIWHSRPYPNTMKKLFKGIGASSAPLKGGFHMASAVCSTTKVAFTKLADLPKKGFHTEHFIEIQIPQQLLRTAYTGILPGGGFMKAAKLSGEKILAGWQKEYSVTLEQLVEAATDQRGWTAPNTPADRLGCIIGDYGYRGGMFLVDGTINLIKGNLHKGINPMASSKLQDHLKVALSTFGAGAKAGESISKITTTLQGTYGAFNYMNSALIGSMVDRLRLNLLREIQNMEAYMPELKGILAVWKEFEPAYYAMIENKAFTFMNSATHEVLMRLGSGTGLSDKLAQLCWLAEELSKKTGELKFQFLD